DLDVERKRYRKCESIIGEYAPVIALRYFPDGARLKDFCQITWPFDRLGEVKRLPSQARPGQKTEPWRFDTYGKVTPFSPPRVRVHQALMKILRATSQATPSPQSLMRVRARRKMIGSGSDRWNTRANSH